MPTPDGIADHDWQRLREIVVDAFHALGTESEAACRAQLEGYLDELEGKYGALPSILATRGDFALDAQLKESLLERSYSLSMDRQDRRNAVYVAHSLAQLDLGRQNIPRARLWIERLGQYVGSADGDYFVEEYARMIKLVGVAD
jgi:hypothetical protein